MSPSRRWGALVLLAGLATVSLVETVRAIDAPRRVASDADWTAAATEVRAAYQAGDLIVFTPAWADQVGRYHLGDLVTPEMAGRADDDRYGRVWEVSIRGAAERSAAQLLSSRRHGAVQVRLFAKPSTPPPLYDFTIQLGEARVTQMAPAVDGETPCLRDDGGFRCATTRIERRTLEVDYRPRRGILAPIDGGLTTRLEFEHVPLGGRLVGYTAIHDYFSRKNGDGPVDFTVVIDGERVHAVRHLNHDGWRRFEVDTSRWRGTPHAVRFEAHAPSATWRTFGFHAVANP